MVRFNIKQYAFERGWRLGELARKLRMPLSNLSAIAAGRRSVSLRMLSKIASALTCDVSGLFEDAPAKPVFPSKASNERIAEIERAQYLGREKGWVHRIMVARLNHYRRARLQAKERRG